MPKAEEIDLQTAIADGIRRLRDAAGVTQDRVAATARVIGLNWTRSTVADIESGRRDVTLEEFVLLPVVLETVTQYGREGWSGDIELSSFIPSTAEWLVLADEARIRPTGLVKILESRRHELLTWELSSDIIERMNVPFSVHGEAEKHAARALGTDPESVAEAAVRLWRHGLTEERERRLRETEGSGNARQRRGHVTRQLMAELRSELEGKNR